MLGRARIRHLFGDLNRRLRRIGRPALEELEFRALLTAALTDIGVVSNVTGLNAAVEVVGNAEPPNSGGYFLLDSNGAFHNLGILPGYVVTTATGISANGQVIGYSYASGSSSGLPFVQAFLDVNGVMTPLGTLDGHAIPAESEPFGVNDSGQVVGWSYVMNDALTRNAFFYSGGQMTDLGTLGGGPYPGGGSSMARASTIRGKSLAVLRWLMDPVITVNKRFWI